MRVVRLWTIHSPVERNSLHTRNPISLKVGWSKGNSAEIWSSFYVIFHIQFPNRNQWVRLAIRPSSRLTCANVPLLSILRLLDHAFIFSSKVVSQRNKRNPPRNLEVIDTISRSFFLIKCVRCFSLEKSKDHDPEHTGTDDDHPSDKTDKNRPKVSWSCSETETIMDCPRSWKLKLNRRIVHHRVLRLNPWVKTMTTRRALGRIPDPWHDRKSISINSSTVSMTPTMKSQEALPGLNVISRSIAATTQM